MTVIAYIDGVLAADRQSNFAGARASTRKLYRTASGLILGGSGDSHQLREMHEWFENGRQKETLPSFQKSAETCCEILCIENRKIWFYGNSHIPLQIHQKYWALGSGRDFALGAMACGKSAYMAVKIANLFSTGCGIGIDTMRAE